VPRVNDQNIFLFISSPFPKTLAIVVNAEAVEKVEVFEQMQTKLSARPF
jgi:hypothetical protein